MSVKFTIYGKPQFKRRVRATARSGFIRTYSHPDQVHAEHTIESVAMQHRPERLLEGMLIAIVTAYFPIPKSTSKKKKRMMMAGSILPTKKPDCDNIAKIYLDALNGIIYGDDKQIVILRVTKLYDETPRVEIELAELKEMSFPGESFELNEGKKG